MSIIDLKCHFFFVISSNISDQVKVGFYSLDRYTQTESSDILPIAEATHNLIYLCKVCLFKNRKNTTDIYRKRERK